MFLRSRKQPGTFHRLAVMLFLMEWVRGAILVVFLPTYAVSRMGFDLTLIGTAVSVHYLTDTAVKGFIGYLLDRYSPRRILLGGFGLAALGFALMITANAGWVMLTASGMLGIGFSPIWLVCLGQLNEENRAARMGQLYVYWLTGLGLGPVLLNFVMDIGDKAAMLTLIAAFALGWLVLGKSELPAASRKESAVPLREQIAHLWSGMKKAGFLLPGMVLQTTAAGMLVPFISVYAVDRLGLSHSELSMVMMAGGGCAVAALIPMGKLFDRIGGKWFLVAGFGFFAGALYAFTYADTFVQALALAMAMGLAYAALLPAWNATMARYVPQDSQGTGWGIFSSVEGLGVVLGPLVGSWIAGAGDITLTFLASAALFAVISFTYLCMPSYRFSSNYNVALKIFPSNER